MKKIIALILALTAVFALVSCDDSADHSALEPYKAAISATEPTRATINVSYTDNALGVTLDGTYVAEYGEDGATVTYEYEKINEIGASDEMVSVIKGTVTVADDGTVDGDIDAKVSAATAITINLDPSKITYSIARGILTVSVKAADTEAVLGVAIAADVSMTMTVSDGGKIGSVSYSYATANGVSSVVCFYE